MSKLWARVELKNVKHAAFASQETACFTADVYINGEKAGTVQNDGCGGPNNYHPQSCEMVLNNIAAGMPDVEYPMGEGRAPLTIKVDADILIGDVLNEVLQLRKYQTICRRATHFRLKSETYQKGEWRYLVKQKFTPEAKAYLVKKYGDDLGEILNERIASKK